MKNLLIPLLPNLIGGAYTNAVAKIVVTNIQTSDTNKIVYCNINYWKNQTDFDSHIASVMVAQTYKRVTVTFSSGEWATFLDSIIDWNKTVGQSLNTYDLLGTKSIEIMESASDASPAIGGMDFSGITIIS